MPALGACAATPTLPLPQAARRVAVNVAHEPSDDGFCGPAVLAMLLAAAGRPAPAATLAGEVVVPGRQGSLQAEMLAVPRRRGLLAMTVPGGLDGAWQELEAGLPVALLLNLALPFWPRWHYAVLTGLDGPARQARLHSGLHADQAWPLATLQATWARSGHWAFVIPPPGRLPATATRPALQAALLALDRTAPGRDTALAWEAGATRWPDDVVLAGGSANAWLAAGDAARAEQRLAASAARLDAAPLWNNLAQLQLRRGDRAAARGAARRALDRAVGADARWREAALSTLAQAAGP